MAERLAAWQEQSKLTVRSDRMDRRLFRELYEESPTLDALLRKAERMIPEGGALLQDIFSSLFKQRPVLRPPEEIRPSAVLNRKLMEVLFTFPEWRRLRQSTCLDAGAAALAVAELTELLMEQMQNGAMQDAAREAGQAARSESKASLSSFGGDEDRAERALAEADAHAERAREMLDQQEGEVRAVVYRALTNAGRSVGAAKEAISALGLPDQERRQMPVQEQLDLFRRLLSPEVQQIAALSGRYRRSVHGRLTMRVKRPVGELIGYEYGRDVDRMLPSELALLGHPLARHEFMRRFAEGQVAQYTYREPVRVQAPPLIVVVDRSNSTNEWVVEGQFRRRDWISAAALMLLDLARAEGRAICYIYSGTVPKAPGAEVHVPHIETLRLDPQRATVAERLAVVTTWIGGSTPLPWALQAGVQLMRQDPALAGADMVYLTDGEFKWWTPELIAETLRGKEETGYRLVSIVTGGADPEGVRPVSDAIYEVAMDEQGMLVILDALDALDARRPERPHAPR